MKRFNFRLERLLSIKKHLEKQAEIKYADILQKKVKLENENKAMKKEILEGVIIMSKNNQIGNNINLSNLKSYNDYIENLTKKIKLNLIDKQKLEPELKEKFNELKKATKERKTFDKLKDIKYKQYKKDVNREDIKKIDEIAGQLEVRKKL